MHLKIAENQEPQHYSLLQLREDHPEESFPVLPSDKELEKFGVYPYSMDETPVFDEDLETVQLGAFRQENSSWKRGWIVVKISKEDAARNKRVVRDMKLSQSDWTQLKDSPVNQIAWAGYRQALREVPQQSDFPYTIVWPKEPE